VVIENGHAPGHGFWRVGLGRLTAVEFESNPLTRTGWDYPRRVCQWQAFPAAQAAARQRDSGSGRAKVPMASARQQHTRTSRVSLLETDPNPLLLLLWQPLLATNGEASL